MAEAAAELGVIPQVYQPPVATVPLLPGAYKHQVMALTRQLWQEQQPERRLDCALALAEATVILGCREQRLRRRFPLLEVGRCHRYPKPPS